MLLPAVLSGWLLGCCYPSWWPRFLRRVVEHPVLQFSNDLQTFLEVSIHTPRQATSAHCELHCQATSAECVLSHRTVSTGW